MKFNGFRSISEYEQECQRLGWKTRRVPCSREMERYFILIVTPPQGSGSAIEAWHLFDMAETREVLDGVINGVKENFLGNICGNGKAVWMVKILIGG